MKLDVPARPFGGYIFDCDGTIAHTMPLHYRAWKRTLDEAGGEFPEELFYEWGGRPAAEIVELLHEVEPIEPVLEIARRMHGVAPLAVASGGHREIVLKTLNYLGIAGLFDAVVGYEDYERGKPAPDPFLEAARRIGVAPADCLVFEDSPTGVEAATAAGMQYVFVPSAP